jgi:hypothetical protein
LITFVDEKGTEHSALVAYSVTNAVNGELSVKGTIYTNDKVLHGIGRGWRFRLDDEYFRITYAKPNDTGRQIEVEFDAVHQFFYDMSKSMVYTILNGSKPFETYLQAIFSGSGYTYNLETTVGSIRKENFGNKSRLSLFNDIIKAAGLEFSVRGHVIRILKRIGTDLSTIVRKDFNMNELKIEKDINSFVTYQRGLGAWKDDEDHSKGRYETSYESPLSAIYGRIEADPVVDERYKDTGKLLERLKENVDKSYKVSVEIDMEDLSQAGYRISRPNPGDYIMAINETLGFRQKVRIVSFTSEYDVGGNLISRKVVCNDIGTVQRVTSEISHLSRTLTDSIEGSERALKTATKALVSADGKNTNYFGDVKPLDVPKGTLRKGDRLFLTVGDKKQLYFWNGAEWELEPTEFDHEKFDMEFNRNSQEIKKTIQENRQKAIEALQNAGASSLLAQEAKRIGLDSIAKLEAFKSQTTSAQTALSGDLDALKQTVTSEVNQASEYRRTTTEALSRMTGQMNGFATKSEVKQGIDGLTQTFAKMKVGGRNYYRDSEKVRTSTRFFPFPLHPYLSQKNVGETWTLSFDIKINEGGEIRPLLFYHYQNNRFGLKASANITPSKEWQRFTFTGPVIFPNDDSRYSRGEMALYDYAGNNNYSVRRIKLEKGTLATDWSPAIEDTDGLITEAKAIFERTAQGLRTDLSAIQEYVNKDGQRQDALQRYAREESAKQATAVRELVARDYVGKSTYQEDVRGLERRFEAITNPQNGSIATQIANYKTAVDGRFSDITSLIAGKANQTDFQRVKETSQLYERILGNSENGIADKIARMAMTNQLFQVEVSKVFENHRNLFLSSTATKGFLGNAGVINVANSTQKEITSDFISVEPNEKIIFQHWVTLPENGMAWTAWQFFDKNKNSIDVRRTGLNAYKTTTGKQHNINQIIVPANAYFIRVSARMYNDGLIKIERGSAPSNYSATPEDTDEAIRTVQSQLAGSWGVHNKNSVNEIIAGFNLAGRNAGIKAETIRLEGNTLADKLTAIDGYFKRLFVGEGTFATLNTDVIRTNSITADKLVFNEALANRMVSNEIITSKLVASRAFVNALNAVTIDASQIVTGTLKGDRIYGGTIRGTEINGTAITGNSRMTIGDNGFLRPTQEGGLQINVPETYSANKGIGVQLFGRNFGKIPKGMFIYNSPNWNGGNIIGDNTEDILLTVKGRVSLCNLHNGSPVSGVPIISNFEYQNPIRNLYPIRFIGWDPRSNQLYVDDGTGKSGTWWISVDGSTSDKNLKTNIGDTHYNALDFVQKLMFKEFDWKTDKFGYKKPYTNVGLIAQDVEKIDSSLVYKKGETLALDDFRLLNIALKAIQELALENRKLTHRLENLENERRTA